MAAHYRLRSAMRTVALVTVSLGIVVSIASAAPAARSVGARSPAPVRMTFRAGYSICLVHADGTQRRRFVRVTKHFISRVTWSQKGKYAARSHYESSPYSWGDVVIFRVEPESMWAYAMKPADYPE
jgi:hypothetical protein